MPIGSTPRRRIARPASSATSPLPPASAGASSGWPLHQQELPRAVAARPLQGCRIWQDTGVSEQSFRSSSPDHCRPLQNRWQVELFVKWINQHLRIKQFYGTSENAVKTQIWIAVSVYVLVAIVRKRLDLDASLDTLLQIFSVTLFEKIDLKQALTMEEYKPDASQITKQLNLFVF